jgi:hypothetical protein
MKALQSVGQIIAEVLKQLDNDRCMCVCVSVAACVTFQNISPSSYCQSIIGPPLYCRMPSEIGQVKVDSGCPSILGYDYTNHYASVAEGSRSAGL